MLKEEALELKIRECFVSGKTNIVQSNYIIERKQKLSLPATQLLFTLTGMINKDDDDLKEYKVDVSSFANLWNVDPKVAYQAVTNALEELRSKGINQTSVNPKNGKKTFETIGFISYGKYEQGSGYALVNIHPKLKPHYISLKDNFTKFSLNNIIQLQESGAQVNTIRTYELLKQYEKIGKRDILVDAYKEQLGLIVFDRNGDVISEKYKGRNASLVTKVLEPAKEKINSNTDIFIDYEISGRGDKAVIHFTIKPNSNKKTSQPIEASFNENNKEDGDSISKSPFSEETLKQAVDIVAMFVKEMENIKRKENNPISTGEITETEYFNEFLRAFLNNGDVDETFFDNDFPSEQQFENSKCIRNPLELAFETDDEKREYVEGYLETHFKDEVCKDYLVDVIPEDVHGYEEAKVEAIKNVAMQYVTYEQTSESSGIDRTMQWHTNLRKAVQAYTKQKWLPNHQYKVQSDAFEYFKSCLGYWLADNSKI